MCTCYVMLKSMAIYGNIFSQKQFIALFGPRDEPQSNGLSNDSHQCNKIHPFTNSSSIVCKSIEKSNNFDGHLENCVSHLENGKFEMANEKIFIRKD